LRRHQLSCVVIAVSVALFCGQVRAQETAPASPTPTDSGESKPPSMGTKIARMFSRPLHPVVETIASGGGIGAGIGYDFPTGGNWQASSKAVVTPKLYWSAQLDGGYRTERAALKGYGRMRRMNRLNFYGPGPDSDPDLRTTFTLKDPVVGVMGSFKVVPPVQIGGRFESVWPDVSSGRGPEIPSIEEYFAEREAPGLIAQSRFRRYQTYVQATVPADAGWTFNQGGTYRVSYDVYDDVQFEQFGFERVELEGRHKFAMFRPYHSLTLHGWISSTAAKSDQKVPFFLQQTLGGNSNLRSVDERLIGTDGSYGTLRGYPNLLFRDNNLLLLQAEYRWSVWRLVDATVFADAGKAVSRRDDLDLSGLKTDYGFSVNVMRGASTVARVDVGLGGGEGMHIFFSIGGLIQ
jgi:hypothetical protein